MSIKVIFVITFSKFALHQIQTNYTFSVGMLMTKHGKHPDLLLQRVQIVAHVQNVDVHQVYPKMENGMLKIKIIGIDKMIKSHVVNALVNLIQIPGLISMGNYTQMIASMWIVILLVKVPVHLELHLMVLIRVIQSLVPQVLPTRYISDYVFLHFERIMLW